VLRAHKIPRIIIKEFTEQMKTLGKEKIKAENAKLKPTLEKMLSRKQA
jgi:hypothetical protein